MANVTATKKVEDFVDDLKTLLDYYEVPYPDEDFILELEIKSAINTINNCRRFTPTDTVLYDVKYEDKILPLTVAGFMKNGAEGEVSHTENGIMRQYSDGGKYPKSMLIDIVPLTKWG